MAGRRPKGRVTSSSSCILARRLGAEVKWVGNPLGLNKLYAEYPDGTRKEFWFMDGQYEKAEDILEDAVEALKK